MKMIIHFFTFLGTLGTFGHFCPKWPESVQKVAKPQKVISQTYFGTPCTPPQVCPSCRAFFRRSVQSGYNATYFCVKDGSCQVDDFYNFDERDIGYGMCVDGRVDHDDDDDDLV